MKTINEILLIFCFLSPLNSIAQNNSLQLGDGVITVCKGACITINQKSSDGITRNNGLICSDGETNRIAWSTNNSTGTYIIPFGTADGDYLPLAFEKTSGGTPASVDAGIIVSTYHTLNNNQPFPSNSNGYFSSVTNINNSSGSDNSAYMVDRFWVVCFNNYSTNPAITLTLAYDANGVINDLNSLTGTSLAAQYWNGSAWDTQLRGAADAADNNVNNITGINFSAPWVLVNKISPLPVDLINFNADCSGDKVILKWATASETNSDYFTVERSPDMNEWNTVDQIPSAGNSNEIRYYSVIDSQTENNNYYRLKQTDYDGSSVTYNPISLNCKEEESLAFGNIQQLSADLMSVEFGGVAGEKYSVEMYDVAGRLISDTEGEIIQGTNHVSLSTESMGKAIYLVVLTSLNNRITKKVVMGN